MRRTSKGLINYLAFRNKRSENKQKARFYITDITKKYFRKLRKRLNHSSYPGYKSKKFHNELMDAYFFLIKNITKLMKIERHVRLHTNFVKSGVNEKIGHVNGAIQSDELESINITHTCADKDKQTSIAYDIKGE